MDLYQLQEVFKTHKNISIVRQLLEKHQNIFLKGLKGASNVMVAAALFTQTKENFLYILDNEEEAGYFFHDLTQILGSEDVYYFPSAYKRSIKYGQIDSANEILRTEVMTLMQNSSKRFILVSYPEAISEKLVSQDIFEKNTLRLSVREKVDRLFVTQVLDEFGFDYVDYVYEPGQYATRGSIIDVFSFASEVPYRIDFFSDEIDSIRSFNIENQLTNQKLEHIRIIPNIQDRDINKQALFELLPDRTILGFKDLSWISAKIDAVYNDTTILSNSEYEYDFQNKLIDKKTFDSRVSKMTQLQIGLKSECLSEVVVQFNTEIQPIFHKNFDLVAQSIKSHEERGFSIYILSDSEKQQERLKSIFEDRSDNINFIPITHTLSEGFIDNDLKICCFTDHQIFERFHKYNLKSDKVRSGKFALSLKELQQFQIGDYIVHIDHGVGQFGGLVRSDINGKMQELIKLTYLNGDTIFVSIHSLHKISKYRGKEGEPPRINKLGTGAWNKMKERTKSKVKDIARNLIKLYAQRREELGFQFSPDTYLQHELEASFVYEDTPDQFKATQDVKEDMEREKPMDRLICGDVGFGKTEVAIRAAFKAVTDNKQVAVLVPTTVLAYQHYQTFTKRLKDFPCRIEYLSRARTSKDVKNVLAKLKEGDIDILIGTHRIVGKDVQFKDLGLMIIDEEQKFGVAVKEKLKEIKVNIDTLTLTATPIPRTLQFSLMGARDMSVITTPPPNRYPIQTEVHTSDSNIIKEAIEFELSRNGQVFIISNRIKGLVDIENLIKREVPDARVAIGHGQMEPTKLEQVIIDFVNHDYDVLIATTIIESGIDIPNSNTIIIMNADQFGLSDLHQLRGRVGRGDRKAYAYLLAPPLHVLKPEARRRLQAIENFSELGHGIHIAMQDLDIRGAGNMLGAEQSGFIADLGYEVYEKILTEAVTELKLEEFADIYYGSKEREGTKIEGDNFVEDVQIESDLELLFQEQYIPNDSERIMLYRELDNIKSESEIEKFTLRIKDRFGDIPKEGQELINVVTLRILARKLGIEKIVLKKGKMNLYLVDNIESPYYQSKAFDRLISFVQHNHRKCELKDTKGKRLVSVNNILTIKDGCGILTQINEIQPLAEQN